MTFPEPQQVFVFLHKLSKERFWNGMDRHLPVYGGLTNLKFLPCGFGKLEVPLHTLGVQLQVLMDQGSCQRHGPQGTPLNSIPFLGSIINEGGA